MSGTYTVTMGDRGSLVVPVELRRRAGLDEGVSLVLVATEEGIVVMTRDQVKRRMREDLSGSNLVTELLTGRRLAADET